MVKAAWALIAIFGWLVAAQSTICLAHSPYITNRVAWIGPDGRHFTLALLHGDGIFAPDPIRPVVLDANDYVVALGPLMRNAVIWCDQPSACAAYFDATWDRAVKPDPSGFRASRSANFYPEFATDEYGFQPAAVETLERLRVIVHVLRLQWVPIVLGGGAVSLFALVVLTILRYVGSCAICLVRRPTFRSAAYFVCHTIALVALLSILAIPALIILDSALISSSVSIAMGVAAALLADRRLHSVRGRT